MAGDFVTCEDRNYVCCDLMPPPESAPLDEHDAWYEAHVENWTRARG